MGLKPSSNEKVLPLFEYAKQFEDFGTFDGFDAYFIHCLNTSGFEKSDIARAMDLSNSGLSHRLNEVTPDASRFNTDNIQAYIDLTRDPRPWQYLKWRQEMASVSKESSIKEMMGRLNQEMKKLNDLMEKKP